MWEGACQGVEGFEVSRTVSSRVLVTLCCLYCFTSWLHWLQGLQLYNTRSTAVKGLMVRRWGSNKIIINSYVLRWGKYSSKDNNIPVKSLKTTKENEMCLFKNTSWRLILAKSDRASKIESDYFMKTDSSDIKRFSYVVCQCSNTWFWFQCFFNIELK